ncbi:MAG: hypothetical protein JWP16_835 [Alphaproteobacteria bacterium]|jgi:hypothetical protein|nr:hypothetical protein [Alphaproteobacteria bacterium]MDB5739795.1 hypothetical protein [Alphaproteobacteria bacterium]
MKKLAPFFLFLATATAQADIAWVQPTTTGYEARLVTEATACPALHTASGDTVMTARAAPSDKFLRICSAPLPAGTQNASVGGMPLPTPVAAPQRILVLGDTGCRIKGATLQACNDPAKWPFPQLAAAAAKLKPDLIIHVGDYLYRESPCPAGDSGCAGSPWGDNWTTWQADFFSPAAPLLAAAPVVITRGNHEDCTRAGPGWLRLLGPSAFDPAAPCAPHLPLYSIDLGGMRLAVMDDATAPETEVNPADLPAYTSEIAGLAAIARPVWFLHHRPIWAAVAGPLNIPIGGNKTLMAAAGDTLIPATVELQLSGHIHTFESINYNKGVPPQIVGGNGGDNLDVTPQNLRGTVFQGNSHVAVTDGLSVGGFGFLLMTRVRTGWSIQLYDSDGKPTRQCGFNTARKRLDCRA